MIPVREWLKPVIQKPAFRDTFAGVSGFEHAQHLWEARLGTTTVSGYGFMRMCAAAKYLASVKRVLAEDRCKSS